MAGDPITEIEYKYLQEFLLLWDEYYKQLNEGLAAPEVEPEAEQKFLALHLRIAQHAQIMKELLEGEMDFDGNVFKVLTDSVSLDILRGESPIKINHMKSIWHDATIQARKLQAVLRNRLAA
ncbi:hypothetical protein HS125_12550 [bacterium]|nr:hypothetical protein [bacterium]